MKKTVGIILSLTLIMAGAFAQEPSPAPAPDVRPDAPARQRPPVTGERRPGAGMENREGGMDRLIGALAQGKEMAKRLSLTPEQQQLVKRLWTEQRNKMGALQETLKNMAMKQAEILTVEPVDETALMSAVEETGKVRTELAKIQIKGLIEVRKVLTDEQRKQLRDIMEQMKQQPRPGQGREGGMREGREPRRERQDRPDRAPAPGPDSPPPPPPPAASPVQ
ncbi:MAG: Spy/CpxP family protein refolding chaperone [Kiritimatiellia bacterium]